MDDLSFLSFEQLKERYSTLSWIVKNLIPADATGIIFGQTGSYKSFIVIDLSLHIAHGLPWCGHKTTKGSVFFIAGEGGAGLYRRIEAWHKSRGLSPENGQLFVCPTPIALNEPENSNEVMLLIRQRAETTGSPKLIVIDTLSQNFSGVENDSSDIADYMRTLIYEIRKHFPSSSILLIHHTGHNNQDRMRGAYSLIANSDFVYKLEGSNFSSVLTAQKMKDSELPHPILFNLETIELGKDEDEEAITSLTAIFDSANLRGKQPSHKNFGKHTAKFFRALTELGNSTTEAELCEKFIELNDPQLPRESSLKAFKRELKKQGEANTIRVVSGRISLPDNKHSGGSCDV